MALSSPVWPSLLGTSGPHQMPLQRLVVSTRMALVTGGQEGGLVGSGAAGCTGPAQPLPCWCLSRCSLGTASHLQGCEPTEGAMPVRAVPTPHGRGNAGGSRALPWAP